MWSRIKILCEGNLSKYKTTVAYDKELLKSGNLNCNQKNCTLIRIGEKEILEFYIKMAPIIIDLFGKTKKEITKSTSKKEYNPYFNYITKIMIPLFNKQSK